MLTRLTHWLWKPTVALAIVATALTGVAMGYAYAVVYGTSGNDTINETGKPGNFHIYGFQGSDNLTGGSGNVSGGQVRGYDWEFGDGKCSVQKQDDDSYCVHPSPWDASGTWGDASSSNDNLKGGVGPDWIYGGGGNNTIAGSQTYDVITGGPHVNNITGGRLGSAIVANVSGAQTSVTLQATLSNANPYGLKAVSNAVDVYNGTNNDVVNCASVANKDVVFADFGDHVSSRCATVVYVYQSPSPSNFNGVQGGMSYPPGMGAEEGGALAEDRTSALVRDVRRAAGHRRLRIAVVHNPAHARSRWTRPPRLAR